jgi:hypothetical protein
MTTKNGRAGADAARTFRTREQIIAAAVRRHTTVYVPAWDSNVVVQRPSALDATAVEQVQRDGGSLEDILRATARHILVPNLLDADMRPLFTDSEEDIGFLLGDLETFVTLTAEAGQAVDLATVAETAKKLETDPTNG